MSANVEVRMSEQVLSALDKFDGSLISYKDMASHIGFTEAEIARVSIFWDSCFNGSWIYLSDELILSELTNASGRSALSDFYKRMMTYGYTENIDYKLVSINDPIVAAYMQLNSVAENPRQVKQAIKQTKNIII